MANPDPLAGEPFSFLSRADGSIVIHYHAAPVTLLRGKAAARFTIRMAGADAAAAQQLMARATGNFKHGIKHGGKSWLAASIDRSRGLRRQGVPLHGTRRPRREHECLPWPCWVVRRVVTGPS